MNLEFECWSLALETANTRNEWSRGNFEMPSDLLYMYYSRQRVASCFRDLHVVTTIAKWCNGCKVFDETSS